MVRVFAMVLTLMAGCSSSKPLTSVAPDVAYDQLAKSYSSVEPTPLFNIPTAGAAKFVGVTELSLPISGQTQDYHADTTLDIAFTQGAEGISGSLSNFSGPQGGLGGQLAVHSGGIERGGDVKNDYSLYAVIEGTLTHQADRFEIKGNLQGDVLGRGGAAMRGVINGSISSGQDRDIFDGAFIAEKQGP